MPLADHKDSAQQPLEMQTFQPRYGTATVSVSEA